MAPAPRTKSSELAEMLARLEDQMRRMQDDLDARLDAIADALEARGADEEAEALAAERIRSGAAERTQDGAQALAELGIPTHRGKPRFRLSYRNEPSDGAPAECRWLAVAPRAGLRAHRQASQRSRSQGR